MNRSDAAKLRAQRALSKDPDYFAKLAARGKGKAAPKRARDVDKQKAAEGGRNRGKSMAHKLRKLRSEELQRKLERDREEEERKRARRNKRMAEAKEQRELKKHHKLYEEEWDENETTVDEWE